MKRTHSLIPMLVATTALFACEPASETYGEDELSTVKAEEGKGDASVEAVFLSFEFDGELLTDSSWGAESQIKDLLLYTIGHLNGERSVGRLDRVVLSNVRTSSVGGKTKITYHAKLPVVWGRKASVPTSYTLKLPRDASYSALQSFTNKYKSSCVDWSAHDVDSGSMWYYYRPNASGCRLDEADVTASLATVTPSNIGTTGKFPEYNKVWEDGVLKVVAVFGKYEDGATTSSDAGIAAYNEFVRTIKSDLANRELTTLPAQVPQNPGVGTPDITFKATLAGGKRVEIVALLVDNVRTAGATFDARYAELSTRADMITYNGHAGLGANVRALARKGRWVAGQYVVVFMNGCDTHAYVDDALNTAHAAVNPSDPKGTKHVDIVTNAMPAYFSNMADASVALARGLMAFDAPKTYEQIFAGVDSSQVVLVSGEQDNTFVPGGGGGGGGGTWNGLNEQGTVKRNQETRFATPTLPAGRYTFTLSGSGDADLYVRIGTAPTKSLYDCRPYRNGSSESCVVELPATAPIHVMVRGYATSSTFQLVAQ